MPSVLRVALLVTSLGAWACAGTPAPVPLVGPFADVPVLVGD